MIPVPTNADESSWTHAQRAELKKHVMLAFCVYRAACVMKLGVCEYEHVPPEAPGVEAVQATFEMREDKHAVAMQYLVVGIALTYVAVETWQKHDFEDECVNAALQYDLPVQHFRRFRNAIFHPALPIDKRVMALIGDDVAESIDWCWSVIKPLQEYCAAFTQRWCQAGAIVFQDLDAATLPGSDKL